MYGPFGLIKPDAVLICSFIPGGYLGVRYVCFVVCLGLGM